MVRTELLTQDNAE